MPVNTVTLKYIKVYSSTQRIVIEEKSFPTKEKAKDWVASENKKSNTYKIVWYEFVS